MEGGGGRQGDDATPSKIVTSARNFPGARANEEVWVTAAVLPAQRGPCSAPSAFCSPGSSSVSSVRPTRIWGQSGVKPGA